MNIKHRGKEKIKVQYDIIVQRAVKLDKGLNGATAFVEWKRGKSNSGFTKRVLVSKNEAVWGESITLTCTLFRDAKKDRFEQKKLTLTLKEVSTEQVELLRQHLFLH
jgi:hypothetical protein